MKTLRKTSSQIVSFSISLHTLPLNLILCVIQQLSRNMWSLTRIPPGHSQIKSCFLFNFLFCLCFILLGLFAVFSVFGLVFWSPFLKHIFHSRTKSKVKSWEEEGIVRVIVLIIIRESLIWGNYSPRGMMVSWRIASLSE